jgi:hypothetical protein
MMDNTFSKKLHSWFMLLMLLLVCSGCASSEKVDRVSEPVKTSYYIHRVKWPGETLSIIAGWYTGDIEKWKALADANPDINANRMVKGNEIRIPESLLKTDKPMPKEYVDSFYRGDKKQTAPAKSVPPSPKEQDELELFGPKKFPKK